MKTRFYFYGFVGGMALALLLSIPYLASAMSTFQGEFTVDCPEENAIGRVKVIYRYSSLSQYNYPLRINTNLDSYAFIPNNPDDQFLYVKAKCNSDLTTVIDWQLPTYYNPLTISTENAWYPDDEETQSGDAFLLDYVYPVIKDCGTDFANTDVKVYFSVSNGSIGPSLFTLSDITGSKLYNFPLNYTRTLVGSARTDDSGIARFLLESSEDFAMGSTITCEVVSDSSSDNLLYIAGMVLGVVVLFILAKIIGAF